MINTEAIDPKSINLSTLPSLTLNERKLLPDCPAVYFVLEDGVPIYIGQTKSLVSRWQTHHRLVDIRQSSGVIAIAWLECPDINFLLEVESILIDYFDPRLNDSPIRLSGTRKRTSVNLSVELLELIKEAAKLENRSVSQEVEKSLRDLYLKRERHTHMSNNINHPTLKGRVIEQLRAVGQFKTAESISQMCEAEVYLFLTDVQHELSTYGVDWTFERDGYVPQR